MIDKLTKFLYWYVLPEQMLYKQGAKPSIALFASRRGGSSIMSELIASEPGIREIDQPFDTFQSHTREGRAKIANLPPVLLSQYFDLQPEQLQRVDEYMTKILNGGIKVVSPPELNSKNRTLLKLVNTPFMLDYFHDKFGVQVIYISRHPIPQALSVMRNKWGITVPAYLAPEHRDYMSQYVTQAQLELSEKIMAEGDYFQQAILNWVYENLFPMKYAKSIELKVTYEDLVIDREPVIAALEKTLTITIDRAKLDKPSRSSALSESATLAAIGDKDKQFLISKWRDQITEEQLKQTQTILDTFEVQKYNAYEFTPRP